MVSPRRTRPGSTTRAFMPRRRSARPLGEFTKRVASEPKRAVNFAPRVRHVGHLDDRRAERQSRSRRKVFRPQVEVDVELVPRESPPFPVGRQKRDHARVHERELRARVRGLAVLPSVRPPAVSDQALVEIELAFLENLSLALRRSANDQLDGSLGSRRPLDVRQAGLELRRRNVHVARHPACSMSSIR